MNTVSISGRLTKDPDTHNVGDLSVLSFDICNSDRSKKNQDGSYEQVPQFFTVKYWTKNPSLWLQKMYKGDEVVITGQLQQETWEKDGQKHSKITISVNSKDFPIVIPKKSNPEVPAQKIPEPAGMPF